MSTLQPYGDPPQGHGGPVLEDRPRRYAATVREAEWERG